MNHYIRIPPCHGHQTYLNLFHLNHKATPRCTMFHNKNVAAKAAIMEKGLCARAAHRFFFKVCMPLKENKHINKYIYICIKYQTCLVFHTMHILSSFYPAQGQLGQGSWGNVFIFSADRLQHVPWPISTTHWHTMCMPCCQHPRHHGK